MIKRIQTDTIIVDSNGENHVNITFIEVMQTIKIKKSTWVDLQRITKALWDMGDAIY